MQKSVCLITGATGFVGQALCRQMLACGHSVKAGVRRATATERLPSECEPVEVGDLNLENGKPSLAGVNTVIHLAARVHVMRDTAVDPLSEFRQTNVDGTLRLARRAAAAGVRRFIFISTIKVNGEFTEPGRPFTAADRPLPQDPYAISKYEAECGLTEIARETGMEMVIIRPPLVYGPNVRGNFLRLLAWVERGVPLPFANVKNLRSLAHVQNLASLIVSCVDHPSAPAKIFLVSDGQDISIGELVTEVARAIGKRGALFPIPITFSRNMLSLVGADGSWQRLFGSLQVNIDHTTATLGWRPPVPVSDGLRDVAKWYLAQRKNRE